MNTIQIGRQLFDEDRQVRVYHVKTQLIKTIAFGIAGDPREEGSHPVIDALLSIEGVEFVELHPYYVVVKLARMWDWETAEPKIKALLTSLLMPLENVSRPDEAR